MMQSWIDRCWYQPHPFRWVLAPFAAAYGAVSCVRRWYLQRFKQVQFPVPIIVVGNLTVGGSGKTPLVIALVTAMQEKGLRVGIVSRGYGARGLFPREVYPTDVATDVGDEPLLMARRVGCPVVIAPKRTEAVRYLIAHYHPDVIVSDDGLQHYRMGRAIEIAVVDGARGLGNAFLLPAGPLREPARRLNDVDFVIVNGGEREGAYTMALMPGSLTSLLNTRTVKAAELDQPVAAVAAIGNPHRFYQTLQACQVEHTAYSFADHHGFNASDLIFKEKTVVMTEKDAVKCHSFATEHMYYLPVTASLGSDFWNALWQHKRLKEVLPT